MEQPPTLCCIPNYADIELPVIINKHDKAVDLLQKVANERGIRRVFSTAEYGLIQVGSIKDFNRLGKKTLHPICWMSLTQERKV